MNIILLTVRKMVELGSESKRKVKDYRLTRYACYLIAQNGNPRKEEIAFHLPSVTLAAKQLATEMTSHNVEDKDLRGEPSIAEEHVQNNAGVRDLLGQRGIKPKELSPEEDVRRLERRVTGELRRIEQEARGFPASEASADAPVCGVRYT